VNVNAVNGFCFKEGLALPRSPGAVNTSEVLWGFRANTVTAPASRLVATSPAAATVGRFRVMPRWLTCCLLVLLALLLIESRVAPRQSGGRARATSGARAPLCADDVLRCASRLGPHPWLAVYGDSVSRGIFFDVVDLLNTSEAGARTGCASAPDYAAPPHPGHSANYSAGCQVRGRRAGAVYRRNIFNRVPRP